MDKMLEHAHNFRQRAEELRAIAGNMTTADACQIALDCAADYALMAAKAEQIGRLLCSTPSKP